VAAGDDEGDAEESSVVSEGDTVFVRTLVAMGFSDEDELVGILLVEVNVPVMIEREDERDELEPE
jgi:hypothetical protein